MFYNVGIALIILMVFIVTIDLLFIPSAILSIFSLIGFFSFLAYLYWNIDATIAIHLLIIFSFIFVIYGVVFFKFKLWTYTSLKTKLDKNNSNIDQIDEQIGKFGISLTPLRPSGKITIDNVKYDAISKTGYIEENNNIIAVGRSGNQIVVQKNQP